jgi:hypothetical protein
MPAIARLAPAAVGEGIANAEPVDDHADGVTVRPGHGSEHDFEATRYHDQTCIATPILIHKVSKLHRDASAREGTRVIAFSKLEDLRSAVRSYGQALAVNRDYADQQKMKERLATFKLTASQFVNAWATVARKSQ